MTQLSNARMVTGATVLETLDAKLAADAVIYKGALCGFKAGYLVRWVDSDTDIKNPCIAIPELETVIDNTGGSAGDLSCPVKFLKPKYCYRFANDSAPNAIAQANIGGDAWGKDDQTVSASSGSSTRSRVGTPWLVITTNSRGYPVGVYVELESPGPDYTILDSLAATTNGNGASMVGIEDAGGFTSETEVEGALAEIYQHLKSAQGHIDLLPNDFCLDDGGPLEAFADGDSTVPGRDPTDAKTIGIRWNNHGTPDPVVGSFMIPPDADITANMTLTVRASKIGATVGDATKFTIGAFNQVVGALHDADADFGGDTTAMTGNATSKTIQAVTLTLALANLAASPASVTLTVQPKDGTLGTDDVVIHSIRITYQKKLLTS